MRFLSSKTLFLRLLVPLQSPRPPRQAISVLLARFSSSNVIPESSSVHRRLQYEEESKGVRVLVWWDFENCHLPAGAKVYKVAQAITSAVRSNGIKGPITISAFGDVLQLSKTNQEALSETGINLTHVPQGGKNSADRFLITDLMHWVSRNPPPAHLFLISSDRDFASVLHRLRMSNYNILLAGKEDAPGVLCSAASIMWDWNALVRGENSTGKCFNQPPDGPYSSWYGHYRAPLLDPFATKQQSCTSVKVVELQESDSNSSSCSSKVCRRIPEKVVKKIGLVVSLYPKGVSITKLREQLSERNLLDKDLYGHKNFLRLLLSMQKILQVVPKGKGVFLIRACIQEMDNKASSSKLSNEVCLEKMHQKVNDEDVEEESQSQESSQESVMVNSETDGKAKDEPVKENQLALTVRDDGYSCKESYGFFKKLYRLWFCSPEAELENVQEKKRIFGYGDEEKGFVSEGKVLEKDLEYQNASSTSSESAKKVKADTELANVNSVSPRLLTRVLKRAQLFRGRDAELGNVAATETQEDDIFTKDSFWKDVESFINSPRGFGIVSHSKSREELAKNLKNEGPLSLKPLDVSKILELVSMLVSEKKLITENPSNALPFRVIQFTENGSGLNQLPASSGLRSVIANMSKSQFDETDDEKKSNDIGVSKEPVVRSRSEVIADCQKLIKKKTEEKPEGYNMGQFKEHFLVEFGYHLDHKNLGYPKLGTLIEMIPEARIESGCIVHLSTPAPYEYDSALEELGPVSKTKVSEHPPSISEDKNPDSETDKEASLKRNGDEMKKKTKKGDDTESDLLKILGSFETDKDVKKQKKKKASKTCGSDEDKLVDGILVSLGKKPSVDSRIQG